MQALFDINHTLFTAWGYKVSPLELLGTSTGLACVWLTAREKVLCWPVGIANIVFFFVLFYQHRLYSDMFLQVYFLATSLYGWWKWTHPAPAEENRRHELRITRLRAGRLALIAAGCAIAVAALGTLVGRLHAIVPTVFPEPAAFPYADTAVAVASVAAQFIMARKKIECWLFWIGVDILATAIYFLKGINLLAIEYAVFGCIALYGFLGWRREMRSYETEGAPA